MTVEVRREGGTAARVRGKLYNEIVLKKIIVVVIFLYFQIGKNKCLLIHS